MADDGLARATLAPAPAHPRPRPRPRPQQDPFLPKRRLRSECQLGMPRVPGRRRRTRVRRRGVDGPSGPLVLNPSRGRIARHRHAIYPSVPRRKPEGLISHAPAVTNEFVQVDPNYAPHSFRLLLGHDVVTSNKSLHSTLSTPSSPRTTQSSSQDNGHHQQRVHKRRAEARPLDQPHLLHHPAHQRILLGCHCCLLLLFCPPQLSHLLLDLLGRQAGGIDARANRVGRCAGVTPAAGVLCGAGAPRGIRIAQYPGTLSRVRVRVPLSVSASVSRSLEVAPSQRTPVRSLSALSGPALALAGARTRRARAFAHRAMTIRPQPTVAWWRERRDDIFLWAASRNASTFAPPVRKTRSLFTVSASKSKCLSTVLVLAPVPRREGRRPAGIRATTN